MQLLHFQRGFGPERRTSTAFHSGALLDELLRLDIGPPTGAGRQATPQQEKGWLGVWAAAVTGATWKR